LLKREVSCRLLFDAETVDEAVLPVLERAGAVVRTAPKLPMKLALFDQRRGMISLSDPVISNPQVTALVFEHESLTSAMASLFEDFWARSRSS
jgi:hypothetical protein